MYWTSSFQLEMGVVRGSYTSRRRDKLLISPPRICEATSFTFHLPAEVGRSHTSGARLRSSASKCRRSSGNNSPTKMGPGGFIENEGVSQECIAEVKTHPVRCPVLHRHAIRAHACIIPADNRGCP